MRLHITVVQKNKKLWTQFFTDSHRLKIRANPWLNRLIAVKGRATNEIQRSISQCRKNSAHFQNRDKNRQRDNHDPNKKGKPGAQSLAIVPRFPESDL